MYKAQPIIILAHGVLGFGYKAFGLSILPVPSCFSYFRNIRRSVNQQILKILEPSVSPAGTIPARARTLSTTILAAAKTGRDVYVIAHSMGGLDFLHAYQDSEVRRAVKGVACIGTPFLGSEVADAIETPIKGIEIPKALVKVLIPALGELTTQNRLGCNLCSQQLACPGFLIAGDAVNNPTSALFDLAQAIAGYTGIEINDGVVTKESALFPCRVTPNTGWTALPDWPFDHGGEIGWFLDSTFLHNNKHINKYHELIHLLTNIPASDFKM